MKRAILPILAIITLSLGSVLAYTPSDSLTSKLESAVVQLDAIMDTKGANYRSQFLNVLEDYKTRYADDERALYILNYLSKHMSYNETSTSSISQQYTGDYSIDDAVFGTKTTVSLNDESRIMTTNALPNHETGSFPNSGNPNSISAQNKNYSFSLDPNYTGNSIWARQSGVAYNGIKFELETAEVVECSSGESYKIEAIQDVTNLGLDYNNAHVQPTGEYHYHGAAKDLIDGLEGDDIVHIGYASDGFPLYYSKNNSYTPSYSLGSETRVGSDCSYRGKDVQVSGTSPDGTYVSDWEYDASGDLDKCNGITLNGEYGYFITDDYPYGPRCMNGVYTESRPGPPSGGRQGPPSRR